MERRRGVGWESPSLFSMTIHVGGDRAIHGDSREGEHWEETFLRLLQEALPPDAPRRRLVYSEHSGDRCGCVTNKVVTCYRDTHGRLAVDVPAVLRTRPAQF
jgi:hypothetical protein